MPNVAMNIGANRVVAGSTITAPLGAPAESAGTERLIRRDLVREALELLVREIDTQTLVTKPGH